MAIGLDCGTSFYIAATDDSIKKQRNAFLTLDGDPTQVKRTLKRQRIPFVEKAGKVHIVGEHAFNYAQIFGTVDLKRPMSKGLLNPQERDALPVLNAIIGELVGNKSKSNSDIVTYCVPSKPIDQERRVDYHEDVLKTIIEGHGYTARAIEEAVALAYEGLVDNNLTGIAISMGAGMCNIAVMYAGMPALTFAVTRGGDWIDENVSADTGVSKAKCQNIKESAQLIDLSKGIIDDIYDEKGSEKSNVLHAIRSYYGVLVNYLLTNLTRQFEGADKMPNFPEAVPIIIGGGTCLVQGFIDVFNEQFDQDTFPIPISEIKIIEDSHTAIARGCLSEAQLIEEEENEEGDDTED